MATTPNKDKVPSNAVQNLLFNSEKLDEVVNSASQTYVDRLDNERLTIKGLEEAAVSAGPAVEAAIRANEQANEAKKNSDEIIAKTEEYIESAKTSALNAESSATSSAVSADQAALSAGRAESIVDVEGTYPDVATGLLNTASGRYFRVPDSSSQYAFSYYLNDSGGAQLVTNLIAKGYVDSRLVPGGFSSKLFPLVHDREGNVPAWFDNGLLDAAGLGPELRGAVRSIPNAEVARLLPQYVASSRSIPVLIDKEGNVPVWLSDGYLDAAGLGPALQLAVKDIAGAGGSAASDAPFIEGDQFKFLFKKGQIFNGQTASLNIAFTGDSWTERNVIPQSLINILGGTFKDPGWISCSNRADGVMSGISPVVATNFTKYDGGSNNTNIPPYGCGPDGNGYYNNNTVGSLAWTGVTVTDLSVFYYDGSGSFTVQIDSAAPVTITGGDSKSVKKYDFSGLSTVAHSVTIRSTGSGVVSILGMYGKNNSIESGITVSRMGNGGAIASDYQNFSAWIKDVGKYLDIDLLFIILGTNDYRTNKGVIQYESGLRTIITQHRLATPKVCICLVSPGQCLGGGNPALSAYDAVMRKLAAELNVNFISGYQLFPKTYDNSNGAWQDDLHMSHLGAYVLSRKIKNALFQE